MSAKYKCKKCKCEAEDPPGMPGYFGPYCEPCSEEEIEKSKSASGGWVLNEDTRKPWRYSV